MAQIAQAYFHFQADLSEKEFRKFGRQIDRVAKRTAQRNFDTPVVISVELIEGSLKGRVTATAAILAIYTGLISDYKGVKESVQEMYKDAKQFSSIVVDNAIALSGVSQRQVYRVERRTKTAGRLNRLINDVEKLQESIHEVSPKQMQRELGRLKHQLELIGRELEPAERELLTGALSKTKLPPPSRWPDRVPEERRHAARAEQLQLEYEKPLLIEGDRRRRQRVITYTNTFRVEPKNRVIREQQLTLPPSLRIGQ